MSFSSKVNEPFDVSATGPDQRQARSRRNRIQLSCNHCRTSKLKCDRQAPCSQCAQRGRSAQCSFPTPAARRKPPVNMQHRLNHLESLVKDVMAGQVSTNSTMSAKGMAQIIGKESNGLHEINTETGFINNFEKANGVPSVSGSVVHGKNDTAYIGATHWAAILEDASRELHLSRRD
jgi:hypothetical protein